MRKVAIVGVEGSGKTVLLAGLGDLYSRPDDRGYYLAPKDFKTAAYIAEKISRMRQGEWPSATAEDVTQGLDWTLRRRLNGAQRPVDVCEISCLDFAGEVYRRAFVDSAESSGRVRQSEVDELKGYVAQADVLLVLVNLSDVITHGQFDRRVQESMWVTNAILHEALKEREGKSMPQAAIVLSQADRYVDTIRACGGARQTLETYLPMLTNDFGWLKVFEAWSVDETELDSEGRVVPAKNFKTTGLRPILDWILERDVLPDERADMHKSVPKAPNEDTRWAMWVFIGMVLVLIAFAMMAR